MRTIYSDKEVEQTDTIIGDVSRKQKLPYYEVVFKLAYSIIWY